MASKSKTAETPADAAVDAFPAVLNDDTTFVRPARPAKEADPRIVAIAQRVVDNGVAVLDVSHLDDKARGLFGRKVGAVLKTLAPGRRVLRIVGTIGDGKAALKITLAPVKS